ncbi:hypothetical protein [Aquimarina agarivorans]|uniref:hypothetical protein n=1 Tax=Aquimarina agarivorans TaxID=980584 RepID=UPI000248F028|nr:hypothetical protein [Aquimarina agarivorans]
MKTKSILLALCGLAISFNSCSDDDDNDPVIENEEEVITNVNFTLTADGADPVTFTWVDADGEGPAEAVAVGGTLKANTTYSAKLELSNVQNGETEDVTEEIEEEDEEHQLFYSTNISGLSVTYTDKDGEGNPIGLETELKTGAAGKGTITIFLRHEPNKSAEGVAEGNIANAGGVNELDATFDVDVVE